MEPIGIGDVISRISSIQAKFGVGAAVSTAGVTSLGGTGTATAAGQQAQAFATTFEQAAAPSAATGGAVSAAGASAGVATAGGAKDWHARLPEAGRRWAGAIEQAAAAEGVDPKLLASLVWAESGFDVRARSHAGAVGLAQLMPATARGLGADPRDPIQNLHGGARYLKQQLDRFGSPTLALAAYNAGPNRVAQAGGVPNIRETQGYVTKVLGYQQRLG